MAEVEAVEADIDLRKYLDILLRRRWIILAAAVVCVLSTALYVYTATPVYQAKSMLLIEKAREGAARFSENAVVENTQDDYYQTQYMLLKSDSLLQQVYDGLKLAQVQQFEPPRGLEKLKGAVNIAPVRRSRLLHVEVESPDRALAARIANALSEAFVKQNLENQLFISKDILAAMALDSNTVEGRRQQESLPAVVNSPLIQQLKTDYIKLRSQAAHLANRYTEKHPERLAVEANLLSLTNQIRVETDKIVAALKTDLSGQLKGNNVRIVDLAKVPDFPFKPRKMRALLASSIGGVMLGFLLALLVETLDQTIRTQEDVEQKLRQPFLGMIPFLEIPKKDAVYAPLMAQGPSLTGEAFRNLRTMADFAHVADSDKSFLVTSSVQEEGKTYVASNLAVSFAQLGEKVLIIDGDLRRPQMHKNFSLSTERGLSNFLAAGQGVEELASLVVSSDVPGLWVLPCGTRPPNPSELLNTPRLSALLAWAKQNYDRVVVDCTPMFPIHDTLLWGRHIRTAVFVVRYGRTRVPLIGDAVGRLGGAGVKVAGLAVNAAKLGGLSYAGYGYYYQQYYRTYGEKVSAV